MPESHNQKAFHSGEWAPWLYARVDLQKYHSAAALLRNYYVDYRGGASNRPGTQYILQAYRSATPIRLIPFTASSTVSYVLEFGDGYIRFYSNGASILESAKVVSLVTQANPATLDSVAHGYNVGDWVFVDGVVGMSQINNRYYQISATNANTIALADLNGVPINSSAYSAYVSGGTVRRVYTMPSPYAAADVALLKFAQNVNTLTLTHPSYVPYVLTITSAANWTLVPIVFGSTVPAPTGVAVTTTLGAGTVHYAYVVTAIDINGQESSPSAPVHLANKLDITSVAGTNSITWAAVTGAQSYNIYEALRSYAGAIPTGAAYGFVGFTTALQFDDTNISPDFSETPPIVRNPFQGAGVLSITVTAPGAYTVVPSATIDNAPSGGVTATAAVTLGIINVAFVAPGNGYVSGQLVPFTNGVVLVVDTVNGTGGVTAFHDLSYPGSNAGAVVGVGTATPANPQFEIAGTVEVNFAWGIKSVGVVQPGAGYTSTPAIAFSGGGGGAATVVLGSASAGNPTVPAYFQQRLVLAGPAGSPQQFNMSQPGSYYNYNVSNPLRADDAIQGTIISSSLNSIKSMLAMPGGLVVLGDRQAWQVNGGGQSTPITPLSVSAQPQAFGGASDVPPILATYDILYVQAKGAAVRDLSYNFYTNIYTGTDISIMSSHLFFGYTIIGWAYAEEPFKLVWAIRDDGTALSLTFLKEQEVVGWAHSDTNGLFKSVCSVTETVTGGKVDAIYFVVQRTVNGNTVQYIERLADRFLTVNAPPDRYCWFVDAGLQYNGAPATSFTGAEHLAGMTVTGLADGVVLTPFVMPTNGFFTLATAASSLTVGLAYTQTLQTLILDLGEPTAIGKLKKIVGVTVRAAYTLGIWFGRTLSTLVEMRDFSGVQASTGVILTNDLITADARQPIDPLWDQDGQYYITQPNPLPCTILGVVPEVKTEDKK